MTRFSRLLLATLLLLLLLPHCGQEKHEEDEFSFVVFPGAHYLPQLTDLAKRAVKLAAPNAPDPQIAIYDTDATLEDVAQYYVKSYGYGPIADSNDATAKPNAYRRTGDLQADTKAIEPLRVKLQVNADTSKAIGAYKAVEISAKPGRPRATIQRPYFDLTSSRVVDRTIMLMSR